MVSEDVSISVPGYGSWTLREIVYILARSGDFFLVVFSNIQSFTSLNTPCELTSRTTGTQPHLVPDIETPMGVAGANRTICGVVDASRILKMSMR